MCDLWPVAEHSQNKRKKARSLINRSVNRWINAWMRSPLSDGRRAFYKYSSTNPTKETPYPKSVSKPSQPIAITFRLTTLGLAECRPPTRPRIGLHPITICNIFLLNSCGKFAFQRGRQAILTLWKPIVTSLPSKEGTHFLKGCFFAWQIDDPESSIPAKLNEIQFLFYKGI